MEPRVVYKADYGCTISCLLDVYRRTNDHYYVNETKYKMKYTYINIIERDTDYTMILYHMRTADGNASKCSEIEHLTFDMIWKFLKQSDNDYTCIRVSRAGEIFCKKYCITKRSITEIQTYEVQRTYRIVLEIDAKLHETETAFKKKLKENRQIDCKIDFF
jgi:hypothetical protein